MMGVGELRLWYPENAIAIRVTPMPYKRLSPTMTVECAPERKTLKTPVPCTRGTSMCLCASVLDCRHDVEVKVGRLIQAGYRITLFLYSYIIEQHLH